MNMRECEIRPGKVLKVVDNYGTIKASCVGMFVESDDPDLLPPVYQLFRSSLSQFSQPHEGDPIWVLTFKDNPQELAYIFRGDVRSENPGLKNEYSDVEIQMRRTTDGADVEVSYNDSDGYNIYNHGTSLNIDNDGNIHICHKNGTTLSVTDSGISLGTDGESQYKAVCGEELVKLLNKFKEVLTSIKTAASSSPYTTTIANGMTGPLASLDGFDSILSGKVTLDK